MTNKIDDATPDPADAKTTDTCVLPERPSTARAGLPGTPFNINEHLRKTGIDPDRLSILHLGRPAAILRLRFKPWIIKFCLGTLFFIGLWCIRFYELPVSQGMYAVLSLITGLVILQVACEVLVMATERLAARKNWDHYIAGTLAEVLSTIPELVVIAFVVPISPTAAFVIALITIYNNALVFSLYSFFLPKNKKGRFLMPEPITEAGTQILIAGSGVSLIVGLLLLSLNASRHPKTNLESYDLIILGCLLLVIFAVYIYKLIRDYASEEQSVRDTLNLSESEVEHRKSAVYTNVKASSLLNISLLFIIGVAGAVMGGESVSMFAETLIHELGFNPMLTALLLAIFAGMSEYVILWMSHRKREYGIALANAFGGITQVMFLVLPFTLISIGVYELFINTSHAELPMVFGLSHILLLIFLFPTFFVLFELLEEDHTLGILDTTIMTGIFVLIILILVTYGTQTVG